MGARIDLKGQRFGRLTVISYKGPNNQGQAMWECKCDCGNEIITRGSDLRNNKVKSCGCLRKETTSQRRIKDLTGQKFGRLTVIKRIGSNNNQKSVWECQCECGNIVEVIAPQLISGGTQSCGCLRKEICGKKAIDEINNTYGYLTVLERAGSDEKGRALWKCQCKCGNIVIKLGTELRSGHVISCGCIKSNGESKIEQLLQQINIPYIREYSFADLITDNHTPYRFDFSISYNNKQILIEYQGSQHYGPGWGWNTKEVYEHCVERDVIKQNYCEEHNIPLVIIPYTDLEKINENYLKELLDKI